MSWHTFFGAYVAPPHIIEDVSRPDGAQDVFHGCSRSGVFQTVLSRMLDAEPGHDALRFLAAQSSSKTFEEPGSVTRLTQFAPAELQGLVAAIDSLLAACSQDAATVEAIWREYGGYSPEDVADALSASVPASSLNDESKWGDEGDTPGFFYCVIKSVRRASVDADMRGLALVYWSWAPS